MRRRRRKRRSACEYLQINEGTSNRIICSSFKKVEKAIASLFLDSPIARVSEETGIGNLVNKFSDFWTDNFSWEEGKYSPKNILSPKEEETEEEALEAEARDERKLYEDTEAEVEEVEEIISEVYDDGWHTMQADSSYKVTSQSSQHNL